MNQKTRTIEPAILDDACRSDRRAKPFLKWPGGKRWLTRFALNLIQGRRFRNYLEPFVGGGAFFFALAPETAFLSDINGDLINTYVQVKEQPHRLIKRLRSLPVNEATYQRLRDVKRVSNLQQAVRFLYLNRTAFGGMYRLNRQGGFNVPYGGGHRTPEPLWNDNLLVSASAALRNADLCRADFEDVFARASAGDLIYCDPTYTVAHNNNGFIRYNERNFSWDDQKRLAQACRRLVRLGVTVLVSNADHGEIVELYRGAEVHRLDRMSVLCPTSAKRRSTTELLFHFNPKR